MQTIEFEGRSYRAWGKINCNNIEDHFPHSWNSDVMVSGPYLCEGRNKHYLTPEEEEKITQYFLKELPGGWHPIALRSELVDNKAVIVYKDLWYLDGEGNSKIYKERGESGQEYRVSVRVEAI